RLMNTSGWKTNAQLAQMIPPETEWEAKELMLEYIRHHKDPSAKPDLEKAYAAEQDPQERGLIKASLLELDNPGKCVVTDEGRADSRTLPPIPEMRSTLRRACASPWSVTWSTSRSGAFQPSRAPATSRTCKDRGRFPEEAAESRSSSSRGPTRRSFSTRRSATTRRRPRCATGSPARRRACSRRSGSSRTPATW